MNLPGTIRDGAVTVGTIWLGDPKGYIGKVCTAHACLNLEIIDEYKKQGAEARCITCDWEEVLKETCVEITQTGKRCTRWAGDDHLCSWHHAKTSFHMAETMTHVRTLIDDSEKWGKSTYVYFLKAGDFLKIGYSKDPETRANQLRGVANLTKRPEGLDVRSAELLGVVHGGYEMERMFHNRIEHHQAVGEWFHWNEETERITMRAIEFDKALTSNGAE